MFEALRATLDHHTAALHQQAPQQQRSVSFPSDSGATNRRFEQQALGVVPLWSGASQQLAGLAFRFAARRQLRVHMPRSAGALSTLEQMTNQPELQVGEEGGGAQDGRELKLMTTLTTRWATTWRCRHHWWLWGPRRPTSTRGWRHCGPT